ncbi:hypothetical protein D3Y57_10710 [Sphingomonas paeninsulae]|uniref:Uncharacterized protein n=1 Tax=Sphingomonas paeninsulae TaxID=2319844 RepID=A0A494TAJ5_SPHPE|nr:hypothetical protein [Sphingomonas paeninsulae]AYJ86347.1 hypothetical protein D3Y57_10710 [Sphingomonas paeninsulae]
MIGKILGAILGSKIDRSDGDSGVKGAAIGALAVGAARRLGPLALLIGGVVVAKSIMKRTANASTDA